MLDIVIALGLTAYEKIFGFDQETKRFVKESQKMNQRSNQQMFDMSQSADEILAQNTNHSRLYVERMKNDNLRMALEIKAEREKLLKQAKLQ